MTQEPSPTRKATAEEVELFNALRNDDPRAFARYYKRFAAPLLRFALNSLSLDQAHEVASEALLEAVRTFDPDKHRLRTWVHKVCRDGIRERIRVLKQGNEVGGYISDSTFARLVPADQHEVDPARTAGWGELKDKERAVLGLRYYAGMRDVEIAQALRMDPGDVCKTAKRALKKLRRKP